MRRPTVGSDADTSSPSPFGPAELEIWGGLECTVNRVDDSFFSQLDRNGHATRLCDLDRFAALGIRAIRYPVLWERTAPDGLANADWSWPDQRVPALRERGIRPILGLVHHGSGPHGTSLIDAGFAEGLAAFAGAVAERYPWVEQWTPVNEPLTTARFSALYGIWYPHARDDRSFLIALLNQCRATVLAMRAIRRVNPAAQLVQTDDLGKTYGTAPMADIVAFYNERRWLSWDLLCGRVGRDHPLWDYLTGSGIADADLLWFVDNPCPPDVIGVNYYVTGERWLDHRPKRYPERFRGRLGDRAVVDIETARALATPTPGIGPLLEEVWDRYRIPIAVTEAHIDSTREDQLRWLFEVWRGARQVRREGIDIRALTVWSLLGSFDWNCLVRECRGYYEPGPYDVRAPMPRATALAALVRELADGKEPSHPVLQGEGWWRQPGRFFCPPVPSPTVVMPLQFHRHPVPAEATSPILISGSSGTLGKAFARLCAERNLAYRLLDRAELDIADPVSVEAALARWKPWAVINASGYVRIDAAESDAERCFRENATGPELLARACAAGGVRFVTFSSDQVFDGSKTSPWLESDAPAPLNVYGASKAAAERAVLAAHPGAMVVRTSAFFGPWDRYNFVTLALEALGEGRTFEAADDVRISPTYVPDLVRACLDLLVDGESGLWHLANADGDVSWAELASKAAALAGIDAAPLCACRSADLQLVGRRPRYGVLASERASLMPSLDDALARCIAALAEQRAAADPATPPPLAVASGAG